MSYLAGFLEDQSRVQLRPPSIYSTINWYSKDFSLKLHNLGLSMLSRLLSLKILVRGLWSVVTRRLGRLRQTCDNFAGLRQVPMLRPQSGHTLILLPAWIWTLHRWASSTPNHSLGWEAPHNRSASEKSVSNANFGPVCAEASVASNICTPSFTNWIIFCSGCLNDC